MRVFAYLREFNFISAALRLFLAMVLGGMIGLTRARKRRPAGFRTYTLVCLAATLTMLLSQYMAVMMNGMWSPYVEAFGLKLDICRFSAQVINGVGFLGAGTILVTDRQEVTGLVTASGLWAAACMGLAIGAGFYECVCCAAIVLVLCMTVLSRTEAYINEHTRNLNIYVEFIDTSDVGHIIARLKELNVQIYSVDINRSVASFTQRPNAVFALRLNAGQSHAELLSSIAAVNNVTTIDQI